MNPLDKAIHWTALWIVDKTDCSKAKTVVDNY